MEVLYLGQTGLTWLCQLKYIVLLRGPRLTWNNPLKIGWLNKTDTTTGNSSDYFSTQGWHRFTLSLRRYNMTTCSNTIKTKHMPMLCLSNLQHFQDSELKSVMAYSLHTTTTSNFCLTRLFLFEITPGQTGSCKPPSLPLHFFQVNLG